MMTDEQRYLFDLNGYLAVKGVLSAAEIAQMQREMDEHGIKEPGNNPNQSRFGAFLEWGPLWRNLIDHPKILPILAETVGPKFRLDHAYGMASRAVAYEPSYLHHEAGMFHHGCYYVNHGNRMHNGLLVVSFALTDIKPGAGGFACVPGSHKGLYPMPKEWVDIEKSPIAIQVPQKAGDVVIFTEALTHGTWPWKDSSSERRSVLLKYCPHYMMWSKLSINSAIPDLTERQRLILEGAYVWERPAVGVA